jgi:ubiquinone/menaquinone biosynthesis C-methylase UbiE
MPKIKENFKKIFCKLLRSDSRSEAYGNYVSLIQGATAAAQSQTNDAFSDKWARYDKSPEKEKLYKMQKKWYLKLYGFDSENALAAFLQTRKIILDAGCGLGYKTAWFAGLAPGSLVIGMDFSDAAKQAAVNYAHLENLFFIKGDIAGIPFPDASIDYVNCDQVIMHTQEPDETFSELIRVTKEGGGELACYFYAKKSLPRELLDDHFRSRCKEMSKDELWKMSEQLAELGKRLSDLKTVFDAPDIPALGIKGGQYDIQRFLYWNFIKCFWNAELGRETSVVVNYDWYSPTNARRYEKKEVMDQIHKNGLSVAYFHEEEACYSGRFAK